MNVTNVTNSSLIQNTSMEDRKLTEEACEFIAAIGAGLFYGAIFILMILCTRYNYCPKPEACKVLFLVGTAVMLLHIFTNDKYEDIDDLKVKLGFGISANLTIGITTLLMALWIFKKRPSLNCTENCPIPCINPHHKDDKVYKIKHLLPMNFVGVVTLIILVMETVFLVKTGQKSHEMKKLILGAKSVYLIEKILQAIVYWLLCKTRCVTEDKVNQAQFYFKVMSFYNGVIWLDSMVNTEHDLILADVKDSGPPWVNIFGTLYKACIIDYRMMFCLVFIEHDLALSNREGVKEQDNTTTTKQSGFVDNLLNCISLGSLLGCVCCILQFSCLANFVKDINTGAWIHGLTIIAETIIAICCWKLLMNLSGSENRESNDNKRPHGLKIVLCCFGAVGLAYWFYAAVLVTSWAISKNGFNDYFNWSSAKYYYRCLTAFHLIYTFMKTTMENMTTISFCRSKCNHFLTGCLVLGMFSEFLGAALDQYVGPIEERYHKEVTKTSFRILLEVGPALYLAFCIHATLHLFSIQGRMKEKIKERLPEAKRLINPEHPPKPLYNLHRRKQTALGDDEIEIRTCIF